MYCGLATLKYSHNPSRSKALLHASVIMTLPIFQRSLLCAFLIGLLTGCAMPGASSAPTPYPAAYLPTVIFLTAQSINATISAGFTPTEVPTLTPTPVPSTPVPTVTPTPAPGVPLAAIQIDAPGPMSRIVSPVEVHAMVTAEDGNKLEAALYDETGAVISRPALLVFSKPGSYPVSVKMPFEIRAAGETGTVQVSTKDAHGRVLFLNSIRVLLLSSGASQINPPGNTIYERVVLYDLPPEAQVAGGMLVVKGRFAPYNQQQTIVELVTEDGKSLGLRVLNFTGTDWQNFDTTIPYKVTQETSARLYIYQDDNAINGRAYVYSQPLALNP